MVDVTTFAYHNVLGHVIAGVFPLQQAAVAVQGHILRDEETVLCLLVVQGLGGCAVAVYQTGDVHASFRGGIRIGHICGDLCRKVCGTDRLGVVIGVELHVVLFGICNCQAVHADGDGSADQFGGEFLASAAGQLARRLTGCRRLAVQELDVIHAGLGTLLDHHVHLEQRKLVRGIAQEGCAVFQL